MAGSTIQAFTDFVDITGPTTLTEPGTFVNEAVNRTNLIRRFMKGKGLNEVCQGGDKIQDFLMTDESSTFEFYQTNADFTPRNPQVMQQWEVDWRFAKDECAWTKPEVILNSPAGATRASQKIAYKRFWDKIQARMWTSYWKGMEASLWTLPKKSEMGEGVATATRSYSIPYHINEETSGLIANHATATDNFTTKQTLTPAATGAGAKLVPQQETYLQAPPSDMANDWDLWTAMDNAYLKAQFEQLPDHAQYSEPKSHPHFIATDLEGYSNYQQGARAAQNVWREAYNDPHYKTLYYAGMEVIYVSSLDQAALYPTATTGYVAQDSGTAANIGPRYYGINGEYLLPVWHSSVYADMTPTMSHPRQPFSYVKYVDTWFNLPCRSWQRQFIVSPANGVTSLATN